MKRILKDTFELIAAMSVVSVLIVSSMAIIYLITIEEYILSGALLILWFFMAWSAVQYKNRFEKESVKL